MEYTADDRLSGLAATLWERDEKIVEKQYRAFNNWLELNTPPCIPNWMKLESIINEDKRCGVPF